MSDNLTNVVRTLTAAANATRCVDLVRMLESLGFVVKATGNGNHKVFAHRELSNLSGFRTGNFDCGHGKDAQVKRPYIRSVLNVLKLYEAELRKILGE